MKFFGQPDAPDALADLLNRERQAVLAGRFDVLERLAAEKERLVAAVAGAVRTGGTATALMRLKADLDRNGSLLASMRAGVAAAQRRVKALSEGPLPLETYDANGRKTIIGVTAMPAGARV